MTRKSMYHAAIVAATGCKEADASEVEAIMREDIFHSTLDWQTKPQFNRGAREAYKLLPDIRAIQAELA